MKIFRRCLVWMLTIALVLLSCPLSLGEVEDVPPPVEQETPQPEPTETPTQEPTETPTQEPTEAPTQEPTEQPTEAPVAEPTEEVEAPRFSEGYALVEKGVRAFEDDKLREELGDFSEDAVVYVLSREEFEDEKDDVLEIASAVLGEKVTGYISARDAKPLDAGEIEDYIEEIRDMETVPAKGGEMPLVDCEFAFADAPEPSEVPSEEPTGEPTEQPEPEPSEVPSEIPAEEPTGEPTEEPGEPTEDMSGQLEPFSFSMSFAPFSEFLPGIVEEIDVRSVTGATEMTEGGTLRLTAALKPVNAIVQTVRWSSSDESAATVSGAGVVTAKATDRVRTVEITATSADAVGASDGIVLTVYPACDSVVILRGGNPANATEIVEFGGSETFTLNIQPANALSGAKLTSADPNIASVEEIKGSFIVTGRKAGTVKLTATSGDARKSASFSVRVQKSVASITVPASVEVGYKKTLTLSPVVLPADATNRSVTWNSENKYTVTVSSKGVVTGVREGGPVRVTATANDGSKVVGEVYVTVKKAVAGVSLGSAQSIDFTQDIKTRQINATVSPIGASEALDWKSSKLSVATVDQSGLVTAVGLGTATITATAKDGTKKSGSVNISVVVPATGISIAGVQDVGVKKTIALSAIIDPANATNKGVNWSSSDKTIATVSSKGVVAGLKAGSVTITAKSAENPNIKITCFVTVKPAATAVQVQADALNFNLDDPLSPTTAQFTATVIPANASQGVFWTSSNPLVAKVDGAGKVDIVGGGKANITATATDGSKKSSYKTVTVSCVTQELELTGSKELAIGASAVLKAVRTPEPVSKPALQWEVDDKAKASVSQSGVVKGLREGKVTVTAKALDGSEKTASITIDIKPAVKGVSIKLPEDADALINLNSEAELRLSATASPANASQRFAWSSSNSGVAAVDQNGLVTPTGVATGSVKITATALDGSKKSASITVKVQRNVKTIEIVGSENVLHLGKGRTAQLTALLGPDDATNKGITWWSAKKSVATVNSKGVVTAVGTGTADIFASTVDGSGIAVLITVQVHAVAKSVALKLGATPVSSGATLYLYGAGKSLALSAAVSSGAYDAIAWASGDESVATVSGGVVTAVGFGSARITATARDGSGKSAYVTVKVGPAAESVEVAGPHTVALGKTIALSASVLPAGAVNKAFAWSSDNSSVAPVNGSTGVVTGKKAGRATITARAMGTDAGPVECAYVVDVLDNKIKATKVDIVCVGEIINREVQVINLKWATPTVQLSARIAPVEANQAVTWSTADKKVATVDQNGVVTGIKAGSSTRITATAQDGSGRSEYVTVKVVSEAVTIKIEGDLDQLAGGHSTGLYATVQPANRAATGVNWASSDEALAMVDEYGTVTANSEGRTGPVTITAASSDVPGATATYALTICSPISWMGFSCEEVLLDINSEQKSAQAPLSILPATACTDIRWTIEGDDGSIATVAQDGTVTGVASGLGLAYVRAEAMDGSGAYAQCPVRVVRRVQSVEISAATTRLYSGEEMDLVASIAPSGAGQVDDPSVAWESSNHALVSVNDNGRVFVAPDIEGIVDVTITATALDGGGATDSIALTVSTVDGAGLVYAADGEGMAITGYTGSETAVRVPAAIAGTPITRIKTGAFAGANCAAITSIAFPDGVVFEPGALTGLTGLTDENGSMRVVDGFLVVNNVLCAYAGSESAVTIPAGIRRIDNGAFEGNTALESVNMPNTIEEIGERAFAGCSALSTITCY